MDTEHRVETAIPQRLVGRTAAALFIVAGAVGVLTPFLPSDSVQAPYGVIIAGIAALITGAVVLVLPWEHWPRGRTLWLVPIAFGYIALGNHFASAEPFRYSIYFVVAFMWIGMVHPQRTSLAFTPAFVLAYIVPFFTSGNVSITGLSSIAVVGPCCVVLGETVAWLSGRARSAQAAFHRELSERRFRSMAQNSFDVLLVLDIHGDITYASPAIERILGYTAESQIGRNFLELIGGEDHEWQTRMFQDLQAQPGALKSLEFTIQAANGGRRIVQAMGKNLLDDVAVEGVLIDLRDITEQKALEDQLKHQAFHDPLTHLANRALFIDRLDHAVTRLRRSDAPIAVLFIDLDDFKTVNDSLGHAAGDSLLVQIADRIVGHLRPSDTAARLGGDEFAILLEDLDDNTPEMIAQRILDAIAVPVEVAGKRFSVGASVGIAYPEGKHSTADDLLRNADVAMYWAKAKGKRRSAVFERQMQEIAVVRLGLRGDLERALERGQFSLRYQPLVDLRRGTLYGVEALVRWEHPQRGTLLPDEFIPLAEEIGIITPLGSWVLAEACRQARKWSDDYPSLPPLEMSVNVSVSQLEDGSLVDAVTSAVRLAGIRPAGLTLEITESVLMRDPAAAQQVLAELKGLGVRIAIDDFGTGYSSLSYLHRFPIDILKIDRSFIATLDSGRHSALVRSIIQLGETLQVATVAEGVETEDQLARLRQLGATIGQGYLFAKPLTPAQVDALLGDIVAPPGGPASTPWSWYRPRRGGVLTDSTRDKILA